MSFRSNSTRRPPTPTRACPPPSPSPGPSTSRHGGGPNDVGTPLTYTYETWLADGRHPTRYRAVALAGASAPFGGSSPPVVFRAPCLSFAAPPARPVQRHPRRRQNDNLVGDAATKGHHRHYKLLLDQGPAGWLRQQQFRHLRNGLTDRWWIFVGVNGVVGDDQLSSVGTAKPRAARHHVCIVRGSPVVGHRGRGHRPGLWWSYVTNPRGRSGRSGNGRRFDRVGRDDHLVQRSRESSVIVWFNTTKATGGIMGFGSQVNPTTGPRPTTTASCGSTPAANWCGACTPTPFTS